jgi:hypothetical protein
MQSIETIGAIHEGGFIKSLEQKGYDAVSCIDELTANSVDAHAHNIIYSCVDYRCDEYEFSKWIAISDDGDGLDKIDAENMFCMYNPKERNETIGNSGLGAKPSLYLLSNKTVSYTISLKNDKYVTTIAMWNKMIEEKRYTGNVLLRDSNDDEIELFESIIKHTSGTVLLFPYNRKIWEIFKIQFKFDQPCEITKSLSFRYGQTPDTLNIMLIDDGEQINLPKYNPSNPKTETKRRIDIFKHENDPDDIRYISDRNQEIKKKAGGYSKTTESICPDDLDNYHIVNTLDVYTSLPHDPNYHRGGEKWCYRELDIYKCNKDQDKKKAAQYPSLVRNNYTIGQIKIEEIDGGSSRANAESREYFDFHMVVKFKQNHKNSIDHIIGTQENKGQLQDNIHISLKRLLHHIKREEIKEITKNIAKNKEPKEPKEHKEPKIKIRKPSKASTIDKETHPIIPDFNQSIDINLAVNEQSVIINPDLDINPPVNIQPVDINPSVNIQPVDINPSVNIDPSVNEESIDINPSVNVVQPIEPILQQPHMNQDSTNLLNEDIETSNVEFKDGLEELMENLDKLKSYRHLIHHNNPDIITINSLINSIISKL